MNGLNLWLHDSGVKNNFALNDRYLIFVSVLFAFIFAAIFWTAASASAEVIVENVHLNHTKDISLSADFKNNESNIIAFSYNVLFDEREILTEKATLLKNETKKQNIMLPIETKKALYDCKKHNLTFFIWVGGQKITHNEEIIMHGSTLNIQISPDGKKCLSDTIEILIKDDDGNIVKNANILIIKDDVVVKRGQTRAESFKFSPSDYGYGVGEYTIIIRQHDKISGKFYCDKTIKFPIKGRIEIMHLPQHAKISDKKEIFIKMDKVDEMYGVDGISSRLGGKKIIGFYNIEIYNKDTKQSIILSYSSNEAVFPLNLTLPGNYTITASRGDDYWTDSKDIEILSNEIILNIDIQKNVKVLDVVTGKIFADNDDNDADNVIHIDSLNVKITHPDGSITIPPIKDGKFSWTPPVSGKYEISVEDVTIKANIVSVFAFDEMFIEILSNEKKENLKVGDTVRFRVKDSKNTTLNAEIYINNEKADTYHKIKNLVNNVSVKKDGFIPINKEIIVSGNNKINIDKNVLTHGEIQTIYLTTEPKTEMNIVIVNKNNNEKIEKFGNFVEFMPSVGEYFVEIKKEGFLTVNGTFTVEPAEMNVTIDYEEGEVTVKIFSKANNLPVQNAKFNILFPGKKNLTLLTNKKGETKFKPDEWGNYVFTVEKENFLPYTSSKEIHTVDPAIVAVFIILLIAAFIVYKYVVSGRVIKKEVVSRQPAEQPTGEVIENLSQTSPLSLSGMPGDVSYEYKKESKEKGKTGKRKDREERNIISTDELKEEIHKTGTDESPLSKI